MAYEIQEEEPMTLQEPVFEYGNAAYKLAASDGPTQMEIAHRSPDYEARYNKMSDFCRAHFPEYIVKDLEEHRFMVDQPFPVSAETEEEMWEAIEKETEEDYVPYEVVLKDMAAWNDWK